MSPRRTPPESVLVFLQGADESAHPGIVDGYRRLQTAGHVAHLDVIPVFGPEGVVRGEAFWGDAIDVAIAHQTTLVVFQYYHSPRLPDPRGAIQTLKGLPTSPVIVSTLGDPFMSGYFGRPNVPASFLQAAAVSDLVTSTSMGVMARHLRRYTRAPILLSPNGVCQVRFGVPPRPEARGKRDFDVVFIGSRNHSLNMLSGQGWIARKRERLVDLLVKRFGRRFGLFGKGWEGKAVNQGPVSFDAQARVSQRGRVVVGGVPFSRARYYTSNRPFIQMTSGTPMVDSYVAGVDHILRPNEHWVLAPEDRLVEAVERTLELNDAERLRMGRAGAHHVLALHTQAHRVAMLLENVRRLRQARRTAEPIPPYLPFFLPDANLSDELGLASSGWPGVA